MKSARPLPMNLGAPVSDPARFSAQSGLCRIGDRRSGSWAQSTSLGRGILPMNRKVGRVRPGEPPHNVLHKVGSLGQTRPTLRLTGRGNATPDGWE